MINIKPLLAFLALLAASAAIADAICKGRPHAQFQSLVNSSASLVLNDFKKHFQTFNYEEFITRDGFTSYVCFQDSPTPWPDSILFFHENKLLAYFGPKLTSKRVTSTALLRGTTVSYFGKVAPEVRKKFEIIYFTYIEQAN